MLLPVCLCLQPTLCMAEHFLYSSLCVSSCKRGRTPPHLSALHSPPVLSFDCRRKRFSWAEGMEFSQDSLPSLHGAPQWPAHSSFPLRKDMPIYFHATLALSQNCHAGRCTAGRVGCRDSGYPSPLHPIHTARPGPFKAFTLVNV